MAGAGQAGPGGLPGVPEPRGCIPQPLGMGCSPQAWQCRQGSLVVCGAVPEHSHFSLAPFCGHGAAGQVAAPALTPKLGLSPAPSHVLALCQQQPHPSTKERSPQPGLSKGIQVLLHRELPRPGQPDTVPDGEQSRAASNKQVKDTNQSPAGSESELGTARREPWHHGDVTSSPGRAQRAPSQRPAWPGGWASPWAS